MEASSLMAALATINHGARAAAAAIAVRDFSLSATEIAKLQQALLDAYEGQLAQVDRLAALQADNAKLAQQVADLNAQLAQRGRYSLVEVSPGAFAYRSEAVEHFEASANPGVLEPQHYICQPCFVKTGKPFVLKRNGVHLACPECRQSVWTGEQAETLRYPRM